MAKLCKAGQQLREQVDDAFPDKDRTSDGWIADARAVAEMAAAEAKASGIAKLLALGLTQEEANALVK